MIGGNWVIKLDVDEWCKDCPEFEPDVEKDTETNEYFDFYDRIGTIRMTRTDTTITCKHRLRCQSMVDYLRSKEKKDI